MDHHDIAFALTDLSDDLLLEAQAPASKTAHIKFRRIAAVAAIIALLAVTVGAAAAGIVWNVAPESMTGEGLALNYYKDYDGSLAFDKLEYTVPLEQVELAPENLQKLRNILYRYWQLTQLEDYAKTHDAAPEAEFVFDAWELGSYMQHFVSAFGLSQTLGPSFNTLEDVEEQLGVELAVPEELQTAIREEAEDYGYFGLQMRIYTGLTVSQVNERKGKVEPTRVVISWQLSDWCRNGTITGSVSIALTEENAQAGVQGLCYSYEKEGKIWQEEQTVGGRNVAIFGNDPQAGYEGWCEAVYTDGGIAYSIDARRDADVPNYTPPWPSYDTAKEMVLALLDNQE